MQASN